MGRNLRDAPVTKKHLRPEMIGYANLHDIRSKERKPERKF